MSLFFIDDLQVVRPGRGRPHQPDPRVGREVGIEVRDLKLEAQFRANGSDSFIRWGDNTIELARTPRVLWSTDYEFDFRIVGSVRELERLIRWRAGEGVTARLVAGFCWPWSDPDHARELEPDVRVGDWAVPWIAKAEARRLGPGIPKSDFWASDPRGFDQVGCVHTTHGFELDYVGVIVGPDLVYCPMDGVWLGRRGLPHDRVVRRGVSAADFSRYVKSTYLVLLARGLRGCYVYFMDTPTRDFLLSRTERAAESFAQTAEQAGRYEAGGHLSRAHSGTEM